MSPSDTWRPLLTGHLGGFLRSAERPAPTLQSERSGVSPGSVWGLQREQSAASGKTWRLAVAVADRCPVTPHSPRGHLFPVAAQGVRRWEGPPSQAWGRGARAQGLGSAGSWEAYRARVWCRNWYCSAVWIMPPLRAQHTDVSPSAALTLPGSPPPPSPLSFLLLPAEPQACPCGSPLPLPYSGLSLGTVQRGRPLLAHGHVQPTSCWGRTGPDSPGWARNIPGLLIPIILDGEAITPRRCAAGSHVPKPLDTS